MTSDAAPAMTVGELQAFFAEHFPKATMDYAIEAVGGAGARIRLAPGDDMLRPGGTVSGPTLFALSDIAFYAAILSELGPVALAVTTNASIDFMRKPPPGADLVAEAKILKLGSRLAQGDVLIRSDGVNGLVVRASMTYSIPPREVRTA